MKFIAFALAVMAVFTCFGKNNETESVKVYFRMGQHQYDPAFGNNRQAMDAFMDLLSEAYSGNNVESIEVRAYTSPDGSSKGNQRLSELRCDAIADYVSTTIGIKPSIISKIPEGIAWDGLRELVAQTPDVPSRNAVLDILDNTPVWVFDRKGKLIDGRKRQLMSLDKGVPYRWMLDNLFPQLRNGVVISIIYSDSSALPDNKVGSGSDANSEINDIIESDDCSISNELEECNEVIQNTPGTEPNETPVVRDTSWEDSNFALKTNLLYYLALMPNIQIEWLVKERWSVALEADCAWYSKTPPHKVYKVGYITAEARFWPIVRSRWHGMYVGIFGGPGLYDLSKGKNGHEGEGGMVGISAGYMWPISKHLSLEAGIGAGYLRVRDKEYAPLDGHYLYQQTKNINYFGPLSLKLSLVWRIPK